MGMLMVLQQLALFWLLLIVFPMNTVIKTTADAHQDCPISYCSHDGPLIQFPFRRKHDPFHCGHPELEVSCFANMTMIQLSPSSGLFPILKIEYSVRRFHVYDSDGCLPKRLLNFTISTSSFFQPVPSQLPLRYLPFPYDQINIREYNCADYYDPIRARYSHYDDSPYYHFYNSPYYPFYKFYPELIKLTLLNCSKEQNLSAESSKYSPITCLSTPGYQVLAVPPSTSITDLPMKTCGTLKSQLSLPLKIGDDTTNFRQYHCEADNVLLLEWNLWYDFPACQICTGGRESCEFNSTSNQLECYPISPQPQPQYYPKPKGHISTRSIIIAASIACFVLIILAIAGAIFFYVKQSNSVEEKENQMKVEKFLNDHKSHVPTRYSYADIKKMTNGFKKKLGEGGFGSVFRGKLPNGVPIAVKVLKDSKGNGEDFVNEVGTIGRIHHVNVVRLLGFSAEGGKRAVIYEHMPNGSLEKFISSKDQSENASFDWKKLHNIINGIAKGIEYLHQGCDQRILHFDIKPHNILLDRDFNPKISDFGLAKLCSKEDSIISMTAARGTVGYIAPELFNGNFGSVSHKSDVYSFGMLVLEIAGARKDDALTKSSNDEVYFPELIYNRLIQGEVLGLKIDSDEDGQIAKKLVIVALWCIQWYPVNRPSMKAVVRMLEGAFESLIMPPNPFASTSAQTDQPQTTLLS